MTDTGKHFRPLSIWAFTDNKPGHRNQLEGLISALAERHPLTCSWIPVDKPCRPLLAALKHHYRSQAPDIILGAGHSTHKYLLLSRLLTDGKTIVLMKPTLPMNWFDLVLIPAHDGNFTQDNIITTQGVINKIKPSSRHPDETKGLFLIGGPSIHYDWDNDGVAGQIVTIANAQPDIRWQLTTSRRTPAEFIEYLNKREHKIELVPHAETDTDWLPRQLADSGQVWVTEDSVSMIYEALTSGACTGLLEIPNKKKGRLHQGVKNLLQNKTLFSYSDWLKTQKIASSPMQLREAQRCAELILDYFNHVK